MRVRQSCKVLASWLLVLALSPMLMVSGEARRGGARKAKVQDEPSGSKVQVDISHRQGKLFSLFNVVTFQNSPCASSESISGSDNQRNGTCHTTEECEDRGGRAEGNCAAGFGVCCIFIIDDDSGGNVNYNCSYIQNPGFQTPTDQTGTYMYTINKCDDDVCSIRLDFEAFTMTGVALSDEVMANCATDSLVVDTGDNQRIPTICGQNRGQHLYFDIVQTATVTITVGSNSALWDIKVSQIECNNPSRPPDGCLQYHDGATGRITTFNFDNAAQNHIENHDYSVCIRQESGFCCVQYQVCADVNDGTGFSLNGDNNGGGVMAADQDDGCLTLDHVGIPESSAICDQTSHLSVNSRYCGNFLNNFPGAGANAPVCACNPPFEVRIFTDDTPDSGNDAQINQSILSRGLCLEYMQIPCAF